MAVNINVEDVSTEVDAQLSTTISRESDGVIKEGNENVGIVDSLSFLDDGSLLDYKSSGAANMHAQSAPTESHDCPLKNRCEGTYDEMKNSQSFQTPDDNTAPQIENKTEQQRETSSRSNDRHVSQAPLAFTIDFGDKGVDTAKFQNLFERYNARHRRHVSMSKVETNSKRCNTLLAANIAQKQNAPSTHSEGYFSSEDDTRRKADQLTEKFKQLGAMCGQKCQTATRKYDVTFEESRHKHNVELMTRSCDGQTEQHSLAHENVSVESGYERKISCSSSWATQKSVTINDLSRVQANNCNEDSEKSYIKNIECIGVDNRCSNDEEVKDGVNDDDADRVSVGDHNAKITNESCTSYKNNIKNTSTRRSNFSSISCGMELSADDITDTNLDVFNVSNTDVGSDDAVSEAGTYTIHKDYTDEEKARMDIDKVFSVGVLTEDESNESYVHSFKMSISRDNNTWISEWATQVAQHNSLPPAIGGITGKTPPLSPTKIPSPIHTRTQRVSRSRYDQSDSSLDAESFMRIKERSGLFSNQNTLVDSGGESDDDTSNSYNTPPHSSQRTPVHNTLARRSSLSESLFRRINTSESRRGARKYFHSNKSKTEDGWAESVKSTPDVLTKFQLGRRSSSLDRKEYASDTTESNASRRDSIKYHRDDDVKHTNSPVLSRLRPNTPKLTNSPIVARKTPLTKIVNAPMLEKTKHLAKSSPQAKNIGYFTCVENSPYMLRKSNSTADYQDAAAALNNTECAARSVFQNSPELLHNLNIQRSSSNASIRNLKSQTALSRRSSFNSSDMEKASSKGRFHAASDSSSETGEQQTRSSALPVSSGIKLNRAFSMRRARLTCGESDTTSNTTPEEKRRRGQNDSKVSAPSSKPQIHCRSRTPSVGTHAKDGSKKSESAKTRAASISRTDSGRFSQRPPKLTPHGPGVQRSNQKSNKDHKKSARSNSTLTSKEVEFQNWKRRKSYDPMKAAAEGRKKLIDGSRKHHSTEDNGSNHDSSVLRSASFHGTGGALSLAGEWSDNEINFTQAVEHIPPPSSPQLESDSDLETSSYLQATQNVVSAMSARMTVYRPPLLDSDNESDEDTSHSLRQNITKCIRQTSDTESSEERQPVNQSPLSNTKYNRAFSLRRGRLETQVTKPVSPNVTKGKTSHDTRGKSESVTGILRSDPSRFSIRLSRSTNIGTKSKPKDAKKIVTPNAREVEMQNWKRRKSYDPMKAAMEGRRKAGLTKRNANSSLSPSSVARSQSFHGSAGVGTTDWSDEELIASADETPLY